MDCYSPTVRIAGTIVAVSHSTFGQSRKQRCERLMLSGGQGRGIIEAAVITSPGGNLIIVRSKCGRRDECPSSLADLATIITE